MDTAQTYIDLANDLSWRNEAKKTLINTAASMTDDWVMKCDRHETWYIGAPKHFLICPDCENE